MEQLRDGLFHTGRIFKMSCDPPIPSASFTRPDVRRLPYPLTDQLIDEVIDH